MVIDPAFRLVIFDSITIAIQNRIANRTIRLVSLVANWCIIGFGIMALAAATR